VSHSVNSNYSILLFIFLQRLVCASPCNQRLQQLPHLHSVCSANVLLVLAASCNALQDSSIQLQFLLGQGMYALIYCVLCDLNQQCNILAGVI